MRKQTSKKRAAGRSVPRPENQILFTLLSATAVAGHIFPFRFFANCGNACGSRTFTPLARVRYSRREKFINGEIHSVKQTARVFFARALTFFFGDAEIVRRNEYLNFSHQADNGEKSERNVNPVARSVVAKTFFKTPTNAGGNGGKIRIAAAAACAAVNKFSGKRDGFDKFDGRFRRICF